MRTRSYRSALSLSPGTAKALVESFAQGPSVYASSSSGSPDSLYSNGSPTFPDQAFEYDVQEEQEVEQHEEDEYESLMESTDTWQSPAWGRWPETTNFGPGWTPSPKQAAETPRKASIISISPRGSFSNWGDRRGSTPASKIRSEQGRRDSDPSLLGFNLTPQTRRSSTRSLSSSLRRSSALSTGSSFIDANEDARLRNVTSMHGLRRRFSEVVEVTCPSSDEDDIAVVRAEMSQWSPYSSTEDEDDSESEIHTAPYFPTPELPPTVPTLLSNFPLSSVAQEHQLNTPSDISPGPSPVIPARLLQPTNQRLISTPPPVATIAILRARSRPSFPRAATDYQFPPRSDGVPAGAAPPRPMLNRSFSTPLFSTVVKAQETAPTFERRVALIGSYPLARSIPLAISPLRASLRRQSVVSDSDASRRGSLAERRVSQDSRRDSLAADRRESFADRRLSIVKDGPVSRRLSSETHRSSVSSKSASRKSSTSNHSLRKDSLASIASRKSSVVSISEYGYLAPQIVVDAPPAAVAEGLNSRRLNAPSSLIIPRSTIPVTAPSTPYGPMESFLGRSNPFTPMPLSPSGDMDMTPMMSQLSPGVMNRGRPILSPESRDSFPSLGISRAPESPKSGSNSGGIIETARQVSRRAIPEEMGGDTRRDEQMRIEKEVEMERRFERRGATSNFTSDEQAILRPAAHRRTISFETSGSPRRSSGHRQATLPSELDQVRQTKRQSHIQAVFSNSTSSSPEETKPTTPKDKVNKLTSMTFFEGPGPTRPKMERASSTSSFTRFFHGKSKSTTQQSSQAGNGNVNGNGNGKGKPVKSAMRPISMDSASPAESSGSVRTLVDMKEVFRKVGSSKLSDE